MGLAAALATAVALGCREPSAPPPPQTLLIPLTGDVIATTATTGADLDPDGYTVTLDLLQSQSAPTNGSVTFSGVVAGPHVVELSGVAANCTVTSSNPQAVTLVSGSVTASFSVTCAPTTGSITVTNQTTGAAADLDPNGYTVTVNPGPQPMTIPTNGKVTFSGLSPGSHMVTLGDVAANCTVTGGNSQTVTVQAGQTTQVNFTISCAPTKGDLSITTSTTGQGIPASYTLSISGPAGSTTQAIGANTIVTFSAIAAGDYTVTLSGVPTNCTVSTTNGPNPRAVTVPAGGTGSTTFAVSCTATGATATLNVTTQTTGAVADLDPNGYRVVLDGTDRGPIGLNATVQFTELTPGTHTVALTDVAPNCTVVNTNPRTGDLPAGETSLTFSVSCGAPATNTRVTGLGAIGPGTATAGSDRQEFDFDVTGAPGGRVAVTDFSISERLIVDADPATAITSFSRISVACVRFGGTARVEPTGAGGYVQFVIDACDNASPGAVADTFTITVPAASLTRSGTLREGDIAISTF